MTAVLVIGISVAGLLLVSVVAARRAASNELAAAQNDVARLRAQKEARGSKAAVGRILGAVAGAAAAIVGAFNPPAGAAIAVGAGILTQAGS